MSNFTFNYYKLMLENSLLSGYKITPLKEYKLNYDKHILLRHDVDFTLENAVNFSKIENELGIRSTYFIRLHAKNYNPLTINNSKLLYNFLELGHEIGLHIEPDYYKNMGLNPIEHINIEINMLEKVLGIKMNGISTHEPSRCGYIIDKENIKQLNVDYEAYLIDGYKYISDSGARWREGDLNEWNNKVNKIIVNTHPVWWFKETPLENY